MKLKSSIVAIIALSSMSFAGGDIGGVTSFENEDYVAAEAAAEVKAVEPVAVAPTPAPTPAPVAAAAGNFYVGGAISAMAARCNCDGDAANPFADETDQDRQVGITGIIGYDFMDYLGAELRASMGVSEEADHGEKMQTYGVYLKPNVDVTDALNVYGLIGYGASNLSNGQDVAETNGGLSYGAGVDYGITENISVFTDVVNYVTGQEASDIGANLGLKYNF
ncbi:MAG: porin family protein [Epsilonproteobacteria bacterium]|nr:porin family protein [Campylobacterota bacterium]